MKLSMWIIANLLESFEPEVHIRRESPRVLRSARLAYATDCVLVQQDGPDCLYLWNEDSIRLPDLSAREGFELLQSLFDSMFDWESRISEAIEQRNFRALVEEMGVVFKNPIALTDAHVTLTSGFTDLNQAMINVTFSTRSRLTGRRRLFDLCQILAYLCHFDESSGLRDK